ncbi:hypothetical protein AB0G86_41875, partial [Streptomyces scabiei]|uniref:hypothetical protein n=1 Tax=Streptomyces scabiei TaxID=1930 RepID=UPI0033DB6F1C
VKSETKGRTLRLATYTNRAELPEAASVLQQQRRALPRPPSGCVPCVSGGQWKEVGVTGRSANTGM